MATITIPNTFSDGDIILASEHNGNNTAITDQVNGNLQAANLATGAVTPVKTNFVSGNLGVGIAQASAKTQLHCDGIFLVTSASAPEIRINDDNTDATAADRCRIGLATSGNDFVTGSAAGDMVISVESTDSGDIIFASSSDQEIAKMTRSVRFGVGTSTPDATIDSEPVNTTDIGLQINLKASHSANAIEVRDSSSNLIFGVGPDGEIRTNATSSGTTLGSVTDKWQIRNAAGTAIGVIPIYDTIT